MENLSQREAQHIERLGHVDTQALGQLLQIVNINRICQMVVSIRVQCLALLDLLELLDLPHLLL